MTENTPSDALVEAMTDDLIKRLRKQAYFADRSAEDAFNEAADLIETQAREIERLREALRNIRALATKRQKVCGSDGCLTDIECFARAALANMEQADD